MIIKHIKKTTSVYDTLKNLDIIRDSQLKKVEVDNAFKHYPKSAFYGKLAKEYPSFELSSLKDLKYFWINVYYDPTC